MVSQVHLISVLHQSSQIVIKESKSFLEIVEKVEKLHDNYLKQLNKEKNEQNINSVFNKKEPQPYKAHFGRKLMNPPHNPVMATVFTAPVGHTEDSDDEQPIFWDRLV